MGDCQNRGSSLLRIGPVFLIVVMVARWLVAVALVFVVADVEVEVEEAGAEFPVAMPITGCVEAETADQDDAGDSESRARQAGTTDHGSAEASHRVSGLILPDPHPPGGQIPDSRFRIPTHRSLHSVAGLPRSG